MKLRLPSDLTPTGGVDGELLGGECDELTKFAPHAARPDRVVQSHFSEVSYSTE